MTVARIDTGFQQQSRWTWIGREGQNTSIIRLLWHTEKYPPRISFKTALGTPTGEDFRTLQVNPKHREIRKKLPREHFIGCHGVKMFLLIKYFFCIFFDFLDVFWILGFFEFF